MPLDAISTAEERGSTGVLVLVCVAHTLHLKATRICGLCEGSKPFPVCKARCTSGSTNTGPGRVDTSGKKETEHQVRKCLILYKEQHSED